MKIPLIPDKSLFRAYDCNKCVATVALFRKEIQDQIGKTFFDMNFERTSDVVSIAHEAVLTSIPHDKSDNLQTMKEHARTLSDVSVRLMEIRQVLINGYTEQATLATAAFAQAMYMFVYMLYDEIPEGHKKPLKHVQNALNEWAQIYNTTRGLARQRLGLH